MLEHKYSQNNMRSKFNIPQSDTESKHPILPDIHNRIRKSFNYSDPYNSKPKQQKNTSSFFSAPKNSSILNNTPKKEKRDDINLSSDIDPNPLFNLLNNRINTTKNIGIKYIHNLKYTAKSPVLTRLQSSKSNIYGSLLFKDNTSLTPKTKHLNYNSDMESSKLKLNAPKQKLTSPNINININVTQNKYMAPKNFTLYSTKNVIPAVGIDIMSLLSNENCPISINNLKSSFPGYEPAKFSQKPITHIKAYSANTHQGIIR
jgi:hypothetical protein